MEQVRCNKCGKGVSSAVPDNTIVRAWVECPECVEKSAAPSELPVFRGHPLTCGGNRHDEAHVAYQKEHGGDFGELISTPKGLMCPVPGCGYKQNWQYDDDDEQVERLELWIRNVPHTKVVPLIRELIEMLVEQEMIGIQDDGVPYHAHSGDFLI